MWYIAKVKGDSIPAVASNGLTTHPQGGLSCSSTAPISGNARERPTVSLDLKLLQNLFQTTSKCIYHYVLFLNQIVHD